VNKAKHSSIQTGKFDATASAFRLFSVRPPFLRCFRGEIHVVKRPTASSEAFSTRHLARVAHLPLPAGSRHDRARSCQQVRAWNCISREVHPFSKMSATQGHQLRPQVNHKPRRGGAETFMSGWKSINVSSAQRRTIAFAPILYSSTHRTPLQLLGSNQLSQLVCDTAIPTINSRRSRLWAIATHL